MFEWPPKFALFFAIVAFLAASVAVRGWRDLLVLVVLAAVLAVPLKWIGAALGLTAFAQDIVIWVNEPQRVRFGIEPNPAVVAALVLAALVMIAGKEFAARRRRRAAEARARRL